MKENLTKIYLSDLSQVKTVSDLLMKHGIFLNIFFYYMSEEITIKTFRKKEVKSTVDTMTPTNIFQIKNGKQFSYLSPFFTSQKKVKEKKIEKIINLAFDNNKNEELDVHFISSTNDFFISVVETEKSQMVSNSYHCQICGVFFSKKRKSRFEDHIQKCRNPFEKNRTAIVKGQSVEKTFSNKQRHPVSIYYDTETVTDPTMAYTIFSYSITFCENKEMSPNAQNYTSCKHLGMKLSDLKLLNLPSHILANVTDSDYVLLKKAAERVWGENKNVVASLMDVELSVICRATAIYYNTLKKTTNNSLTPKEIKEYKATKPSSICHFCGFEIYEEREGGIPNEDLMLNSLKSNFHHLSEFAEFSYSLPE
jgi:hypothetical protein